VRARMRSVKKAGGGRKQCIRGLKHDKEMQRFQRSNPLFSIFP
jgi:hypothetical protein